MRTTNSFWQSTSMFLVVPKLYAVVLTRSNSYWKFLGFFRCLGSYVLHHHLFLCTTARASWSVSLCLAKKTRMLIFYCRSNAKFSIQVNLRSWDETIFGQFEHSSVATIITFFASAPPNDIELTYSCCSFGLVYLKSELASENRRTRLFLSLVLSPHF